MIIVAILKHVAGKSADYGAALDYLKYEHDEVLKKPLLDANGNWVLRRDILLEGINCEPELFDVECEMLNAQYHKNQNYDEIKTHHYLISFDPADKDECGLTGEQAQVIGMEYVKANFPGHQALVCTHMDSLHSSHEYGTRCFASLQKTKHNRCCRPLDDCPDRIPCEVARYLPRKASWEKECALHGKVLLPVP